MLAEKSRAIAGTMDGADPLLTLVAADLNDPDPFTAHADVDVIFHMASPFATDMPDPQRDLVDPAVNGTLAMMRAGGCEPTCAPGCG